MRLTKELPSDWRTKRLVAVAKLISGGTPSRKVPEYFQGDVPWITGNDVVSFRTSKAREYITEEAIESSATHLLPKGSILFVTRTGVGKVSIAEVDICISQDLTGVICKEDIALPEYVARYLISLSEKIKYRQRGSTIKGVTREFVEQIEIHLPPLSVQKKIAAILEKADAAREKRRQANQLTEQFLQSAFIEMFGDPAINPKGWPIGIISDAVEYSEYGTSEKSNDMEQGYPVIGMGNITCEGQLNLSELSYVSLSVDNFEKLKLRRGDVIFNRTNSTELVGKTTYWNLDRDAVIASYLVKLRLTKDFSPIWFSCLLNTRYFKAMFMRRCKKAVGQSNISPTLLKEFPMYIPPLSEQQKFAALVGKVESLRARQRQSGQELEALFNSLMQRAFKGDL